MLSRKRRWSRGGASSAPVILDLESDEPEDDGTPHRLRLQIPGGPTVDVTRAATLARVADGDVLPVRSEPEHHDHVGIDVAAFRARRRGS